MAVGTQSTDWLIDGGANRGAFRRPAGGVDRGVAASVCLQRKSMSKPTSQVKAKVATKLK